MKKKLLVAAILAGAAQAASAANGQPYYGLQGTYIDADNLRNVKEGGGATLLLGLPVNQYFATELNLFGLRMDNDSGSFDKQLGAGLDLAVFPFKRDNRISPFLLLGGGAQYEDRNPPRPQRGYAFADAGGGFLADLTQDGLVSLRVDAKRVRVNDNELIPGRNTLWDTRISAGLQVAFGPDPVIAPPPPPPAPAPMDSDGDGVIDADDQCPGTLPGTIVNSVGCPIPPPPPPPAPIDSDRDGVLDPNDACPGTPYGLKVDERGCAVKEAKIILRDINFEFNSARLTAEAKQSLDKVLDGLKGQPTMSVLIEGHTDSIGTDAVNLKLSKQRAAAARQYLIEGGVEAGRLESKGFGESQPVASNKTKDGRAENRRVEFKVTKQ